MTEKRGRFIKYDKQAVLEEIVEGRRSARQIADRHGITRDMVYTLKYNARKKNIIRDPVQRLDDLDTIQPLEKKKGIEPIYDLAIEFKYDRISDSDFYKKLKQLV